MGQQTRRILVGIVAGLAIAGVAIAVTNDGGADTGGLDKKSYLAGCHDSFADTYIPTDTRSRDEVELSCDAMYRRRELAEPSYVDHRSWVVGCADFAQNKDSRFG
ncbi:hypothetical protein [Streptomyces sp. cg35]|uniref:hypothetical protein n=1 Tax=Streptomyces sp. cg35 TaxID=3421650 RepID=UPI003D186ED2